MLTFWSCLVNSVPVCLACPKLSACPRVFYFRGVPSCVSNFGVPCSNFGVPFENFGGKFRRDLSNFRRIFEIFGLPFEIFGVPSKIFGMPLENFGVPFLHVFSNFCLWKMEKKPFRQISSKRSLKIPPVINRQNVIYAKCNGIKFQSDTLNRTTCYADKILLRKHHVKKITQKTQYKLGAIQKVCHSLRGEGVDQKDYNVWHRGRGYEPKRDVATYKIKSIANIWP